MVSLLLVDVFAQSAEGIAGYVGYVRALGYAIAGVVCVIGCITVYMDFVNAKPAIGMKIVKLFLPCIFLITASTSLPLFFGLDGSESGGGSHDDWSSSISDMFEPFVPVSGDEFVPHDPVIVDLPDGGSAVIWPPAT